MGCDMVLATGSAAVDGQALLGLNYHAPLGEQPVLEQFRGRPHEPGETVHATHIEIPQARRTFSTLGCRTGKGWGLRFGVNEFHVSLACASWSSRLIRPQAGLTGPDLVRLGLERCRTARQGIEVVTDLIARFGQGRFAGDEAEDAVLLIVDSTDAFVVEAAGPYWAYLECRDVRAVTDAALIHQDWNRVSHGLAEHASEQGWWRDDGSKIDFARNLRDTGKLELGPLKRWGRATRFLQQQHGHIDMSFLRRILSDHFEETAAEVQPLLSRPSPYAPICRHARFQGQSATCASFIVSLSAGENPPIAWLALGPPCISVYFPLILTGELPRVLLADESDNLWRRTQRVPTEAVDDPHAWAGLQQAFAHLQEQFDLDVQDLLRATAGDHARIANLGSVLMEKHVETFRHELDTLVQTPLSR